MPCSKLLASGDYFFFTVNPNASMTAFRSEIGQENLAGLRTKFSLSCGVHDENLELATKTSALTSLAWHYTQFLKHDTGKSAASPEDDPQRNSNRSSHGDYPGPFAPKRTQC
jgi:hypothetical protein